MSSNDRTYPAPPWHTHGFAVLVPYRVPAGAVAVPAPLRPLVRFGHSLGMLGYVRYLPPSPLVYDELIWMQALTEANARDRTVRGWHVTVMYVDSEASLQGGRRLWRLPKTLARFRHEAGGVRVEAEDGTRLALSWRELGPRVPGRSRVATLQPCPEGLVRFRGTSRARTAVVRPRLEHFASEHSAWAAFRQARPLLGVGVALHDVRSTMHEPEWLSGAPAELPGES